MRLGLLVCYHLSYLWLILLTMPSLHSYGCVVGFPLIRVRSRVSLHSYGCHLSTHKALQGNNLLSTVTEPICPVTGIWDEPLVRQTLWGSTAEVLQIPIYNGQEDLTAWRFDPKEIFSVKSICEVHMARCSEGSTSGGTGRPAVDWKVLWKLPCSGCLPFHLAVGTQQSICSGWTSANRVFQRGLWQWHHLPVVPQALWRWHPSFHVV